MIIAILIELIKMAEHPFSKYLEIKDQMSEISPRLFLRTGIIMSNLSGEKGRLLDAGCGEGTLLKKFKQKGFDCVGMDISKKAVEMARKNADVPVYHQTIFDFNKKEKFNVIIISEVLQYVENDIEFLEKAFDLLSPNGVLIISEPLNVGIETELDKNAGQIRQYSISEIKEKLTRAGFTIENVTVWGWPLIRIFYKFFSSVGESQKDSFKKEKISVLYKFLKFLKYAFLFDNLFNFTKMGVGIIIKC